MDEVLWRLRDVWLPGRGEPRLAIGDLAIPLGFTAVVGPSGAGKTSLLDLLVGYVEPQRGRLEPGPALRRPGLTLAWVPCDGGLWPALSVREHIAAVLPEGRGGRRIEELLAEFDLGPIASMRPARISSGESSRLAVARALAAEAVAVVMDEPLAHVDPSRLPRWWAFLGQDLRRSGGHLVYATHDIDRVLGFADQVVCLDSGRLLFSGACDTAYQRPPSLAVAACLGPCNWLDPVETGAVHPCVRPERLGVEPSEQGPWELLAPPRRHGSWWHSQARHLPEGTVAALVHRPPSAPLAAGIRVALNVTALLLALVLGACGNAGSGWKPRVWRTQALSEDLTALPAPRRIACGAGGVYYTLDTVGRVLVLDPNGAVLRSWRMPESAAGRPEAVLELADGRIAVADTHYHRVLFFDRDGAVLASWGSEGQGPGQFVYPVALAHDPGGHLYVAEYGGNDRIQKFRPDGSVAATFGRFGTGADGFQRPSGLVWHEGRLYVADAFNNCVKVFADDGRFLSVLGGEHPPTLEFPYDLALDAERRLWIPEYGAGRVSVLDLDGRLLGRCGRAGRGEGEFVTPWGIAVGADGAVAVADTGNRRLVWMRF